jgi:hypothetical protein
MRRWLIVIGIVVACVALGAGVVAAQSGDEGPATEDPPARHRVLDPEDRQALRECVGQHLADGDEGRVRVLARDCADELGIELPHRPRWCRRPH